MQGVSAVVLGVVSESSDTVLYVPELIVETVSLFMEQDAVVIQNKTQTQPQNVTFKANTKTNEVFSAFTNKDGSFASLNSQNAQIANENKESIKPEAKKAKTANLAKILTLACTAAGAVFFASKIRNGE